VIRKKILFFTVLMVLTLSSCGKELRKEKEPNVLSSEIDAEAPIVNLNTKYLFSNDITTIDLAGLAEISDASSYVVRLGKFQKIGNAELLDDARIQEYVENLTDIGTNNLLRRPENSPIRDGIYTAVYLVEDTEGNKTAKELIVFYDTTAAVVSRLKKLDTEIEVDDIDVEYTDDLLDKLMVEDNFDGLISKDTLVHTMECKDVNQHIYSVRAEYTDRAGNKTSIEYDITVKEKQKEIVPPPVDEDEIESEIVESEVEDVEEDDDASHYIPIPEEWNLIVVNKWNKIPEGYVVELSELSNGKKVDRRISEALQEMLAAATADGINLLVREGHRTVEEQQNLLDEKIQSYMQQGFSQSQAEKMTKKWVAEPGTSEHELGIAVDINADASDEYNGVAYAWLAENAYTYGFIQRYPEGKKDITGIEHEPWHFRYVGVDVAKEIYERGICLEEYLQSR